MNYLQAAVLGLVQGVAEFLPISSSGHLTLLQHFFGMEEPDNLFNVLLHFATLVAVCVAYYGDIVEMLREFFLFFRGIFSKTPHKGPVPPARRMILLLILATLPLFLVLPIKDKVERLGATPVFVSCALLVTGCVLFLSDRMARGRKNASSATVRDVLLVGAAQALATVPGLSRSGCTISAGMALGFDRAFAVRFSFLMSLPAVFGATLLKLLDVAKEGMDTALLPKYLLGMLIAGVVGYLSIQLVKLLTVRGQFGAFAYYCWAVGLITLVMFVVTSMTGQPA